jgi:hypothetical protein
MQGTIESREVIPFGVRAEARPVKKYVRDYKLKGKIFRVVMYWYIAGTCPYPGGHYDRTTGLVMHQWVIDRSTGAAVLPEDDRLRRDARDRSTARSHPRHRGA